jgi:hypothetical protein
MKKEFKKVLISALFFQTLLSTTEGAPNLHVDFNTTNSSIDSIYAPAKDSTFTVAFYVSDIEDLYGYQFYVEFDTTRLKYISSSKATSSALHLMGLTEQILFQSNISKGQNNRVLVAASLLGQVPGASGSGYLGVITFQRLTSDTTSIILAEPAFLNSAQSELAISSMSNGLLLPPGSISVKQKRQYLTNYNIQISSRTIKGTFPSKAPVQIRLIDVSGRSVFEKKNIAQRFSFDIPQATSGVYMLSITNHEGSIAYPVVLK